MWLFGQGTCFALSGRGRACQDAPEHMLASAELSAAGADEDWTNAMTLDSFRVQQQKMAAFASGMHSRLGAASGVSGVAGRAGAGDDCG
jgi:hypothetical protein